MDQIIGKTLESRYEIQEIIGIGGMAIVYKAYDNVDDRIVAVKVLKEEYLTNDDFKRRFKNESKAIAVLSHPNIVKVYDVSLSERLQYIVMEYVDGITLKEYIDQQHILTWKEAVHFTVQILRALQHAHEKGIVHRDIKPQNIMMLEDGTIKVADFGIARFANSETRTMTDKAIGSVHYISPEQARGADTDEKSDIYSVGVMLYEMLTGQLPFESENAVSVAIMQMQQEPKRPREINDQIPEGLEDITLRAMQKNPEQRYVSASAMLEDIDEFKQNPSIHFEYQYFIDDNPTKYVDAINKSKDQKAVEEQNGKKKKRKPSTIAILSGIAVAALIGLLAIIFGVLYNYGFFSGSSATVSVPNFVDMTYDQVTSDAQYKNFTFVKANTQNSDKPAGTIISQDPTAGSNVKSNATIKLTVSLGPKTATVPYVINETLSDAKLDLTNAGFVVGIVSQAYSDTIASGNVISTDPASNATANYGSTVNIVVSQGAQPQYKTVPDLSDITYDKSTVKSTIEAAGLTVGNVTFTWSSSYPSGQIISTSPAAKSSQLQGTAINITVSAGTDPNTIITIGTNTSTLQSALNQLNSTIKNYFTINIIDDKGGNTIQYSGGNYSQYLNYIVTAETDSASSTTINLTVDKSVGYLKNERLSTAISSIKAAGYFDNNIVVFYSDGSTLVKASDYSIYENSTVKDQSAYACLVSGGTITLTINVSKPST